MEQMILLQYLLFGLAALAILALAVPALIWRNTSESARLLRELLEEQETTNSLLVKLLRGMNALESRDAPREAPGPDDDYGPDEDYCVALFCETGDETGQDLADQLGEEPGESGGEYGPDGNAQDGTAEDSGPGGKDKFWLE